MSAKLTETFTDKVKKIEAPHEPIRSNGSIQGAATAIAPWPMAQLPPPVVTQGSVLQKQPIKVALVGTAPTSRLLAPFNDPSWEIWVCSPGNMNGIPRVTRWFEIHNNYEWPEHAGYGPQYLAWLRQQPFPIYMQDQKFIPNALVYPKEKALAEFGDGFFTSSFAWMMAFAIMEGASEIALYGIDMASRDEYILQRPGFYYFKYRAEQKGIKVWAPNESDIMQSPPLYGYSEVTPFGRKIMARERELKERVAGMETQVGQLQQNITYLKGALEDIDYIKSIWMGVG